MSNERRIVNISSEKLIALLPEGAVTTIQLEELFLNQVQTDHSDFEPRRQKASAKRALSNLVSAFSKSKDYSWGFNKVNVKPSARTPEWRYYFTHEALCKVVEANDRLEFMRSLGYACADSGMGEASFDTAKSALTTFFENKI